MIDPVLSYVVRIALALLFFHSGFEKARDLIRFRAILADYHLLPTFMVGPAAASLVAIELGLAAALLLPPTALQAAPIALVLFALYSLAIGINLSRGRRDIDCGCFASFQKEGHRDGGRDGGQSLSGWLLIRNAGLIAAASLAALPTASRTAHWLDFVTFGAGLLLLVILWHASSALHANRPAPSLSSLSSLSPGPGGSLHG